MSRATLLAVLAACLACALLCWNAAWRPNLALEELRPAGRYWEDLALSASAYLAADARVVVNGTPEAEDLKHAYRRNLVRGARELDIAPWQFWRTVPLRPALERARIVQRPYEDAGRSQIMAVAYRALGGVAPYFGLWSAVLLALPLLVWIAWELAEAGLPVAGAAFVLACASSCFVADVLSMAYSAAGFHVDALLLLCAVGTYAWLRPAPSARGLLLRLALAGALFWALVLCRASSLALLPAFVVVATAGAWRLAVARGRGAALVLALAASSVFCAPWVLSRMLATPSAHDVWATVWEGLGDFDRSKGFAWSDPLLREFLRGQGLQVSEADGIEFQSPESERLTRAAVLDAIRDDPAWFAGILVKRLGATLVLVKLWPYGPRDGRSMATATHANEGSIDVYWGMTRGADFVALGPWHRELEVGLLLAPLATLLALQAAGRLWPGLRGPAPASRQLGLIVSLSAGSLALPVAISYAASFEPQSHVLVPFLGLGLLVQQVASAVRRAAPPSSTSI